MTVLTKDGKPTRPMTTNLLQQVMSSNVLGKVRHMMAPNGPLFIDKNTKKITCNPIVLAETPWVKINHELKPKQKQCTLLKDILFDCFDIHPYYCKNTCWKIVVHPATFHDTIMLIEIFRSIKQESKVGCEHRESIPYNYGGYMYCNDGLITGRKLKKQVQDHVNAKFAQPVEVVLKRGCTEMEARFGPSKLWVESTEKELRYEDFVRKHFDLPLDIDKSPEFPDMDTMYNWFIFAWSRGDRTVDWYNDGNPIFNFKIDYY